MNHTKPSDTHRAWRIGAYLLCMLLVACAAPPVATPVVDAPATPAPSTTLPAPSTPFTGCKTDADCTVKNVGNCCGYYPACVNKDAKVDPEGVMAACQASGRMSVCGFPQIEACQCVDNECRDNSGPLGQAIPLQENTH